MKSFRFRGARLLTWRRAQADQARVAFVRATESARETAAVLAAAEARCERAAREYLAVIAERVQVATLERYRNWIDRQETHRMAAGRAHQEQRRVVETTAGVLQQANRHVKVMERLQHRAERRHVDAERQAEMKALNELATMQFARRQEERSPDRGY